MVSLHQSPPRRDRPTQQCQQNDLRRTPNECAVDLVLVSEPSTRTVTRGSARHSVRIRSKMSSGTSTGALTRALRRAADEPPSFPCRTDDLPAERGLGCDCGGAEVLGCSMNHHSSNVEPLVTARR